jgi:hypothetical protein
LAPDHKYALLTPSGWCSRRERLQRHIDLPPDPARRECRAFFH